MSNSINNDIKNGLEYRLGKATNVLDSFNETEEERLEKSKKSTLQEVLKKFRQNYLLLKEYNDGLGDILDKFQSHKKFYKTFKKEIKMMIVEYTKLMVRCQALTYNFRTIYQTILFLTENNLNLSSRLIDKLFQLMEYADVLVNDINHLIDLIQMYQEVREDGGVSKKDYKKLIKSAEKYANKYIKKTEKHNEKFNKAFSKKKFRNIINELDICIKSEKNKLKNISDPNEDNVERIEQNLESLDELRSEIKKLVHKILKSKYDDTIADEGKSKKKNKKKKKKSKKKDKKKKKKDKKSKKKKKENKKNKKKENKKKKDIKKKKKHNKKKGDKKKMKNKKGKNKAKKSKNISAIIIENEKQFKKYFGIGSKKSKKKANKLAKKKAKKEEKENIRLMRDIIEIINKKPSKFKKGNKKQIKKGKGKNKVEVYYF